MTTTSRRIALIVGAHMAAAQVAAATNPGAVIFDRVFEGVGTAKGFRIRIADNAEQRIDLNDLSIAIAHNRRGLGEEGFVYNLGDEYQPLDQPEVGYLTSSRMFCTQEAFDQDVNGFLCGNDPVVLPSRFPLMTFNGNDMLVLRRKVDGVDTISDIFGNGSRRNFKICGRKNANVDSMLRRKSGVKVGQLVPLSGKTPCEWDYEPLRLPLPQNSVIIDNIFVGSGRAKGFRISNKNYRSSFSSTGIDWNDLSIAIANNGRALGDEDYVYNLGRVQDEESAYLLEGQNSFAGRLKALRLGQTFCTQEAVDEDIDGDLCGGSAIVFPSDFPLFSFNGNDMIVLRRKVNGVDTVSDIFGNDSNENFTICGRKNANINSYLRRKSSVKLGQRHPLSAETPCEWDYEQLTVPLPFQTFSVDTLYNLPLAQHRITLYSVDRDITNYFLSLKNSTEKIRIKDLERGKKFVLRTDEVNICFKRETYILDEEYSCDYFWDVGDVGDADPETGKVSFNWTLSGEYTGELSDRVYRIWQNYIVVTDTQCAITQENPVDTRFKNFIYNYSCSVDDDCEDFRNQIGRDVSCIKPRRDDPAYCSADFFERRRDVSCQGVGDDESCKDTQYCRLRYTLRSGESVYQCADKATRNQLRGTFPDNMVIPAGENRTVSFLLDNIYQLFLGQESNGMLHVITNATTSDFSFFATKGTVFGTTRRALLYNACDSAEAVEGATNYHTLSTSIYLGSEDEYLRENMEYTFYNEGAEDVMLIGVFKQLQLSIGG